VWMWYYDNIGGGRCPVCDTWWQTETGGILITRWRGDRDEARLASFPFPGVDPVILRQTARRRASTRAASSAYASRGLA